MNNYVKRISEYIEAFGYHGLFMAIKHFICYKLSFSSNPKPTNVGAFGKVYLRPNTSDLSSFREVFVSHEYGMNKSIFYDYTDEKYKSVLKRGRTPLILDLGANIGLASRYLTKFFPLADIFMVEPGADAVQVAHMNIKNFNRLKIFKAAVWNEPGVLFLGKSTCATTRSIVRDSNDMCDQVKSLTVDELIAGREADLFLIKIDIEGSEKNILSSCSTWLRSMPIIMIEPHDGTFNKSASLSGLLDLDEYRNGFISISGLSTLCFVPKSIVDSHNQ